MPIITTRPTVIKLSSCDQIYPLCPSEQHTSKCFRRGSRRKQSTDGIKLAQIQQELSKLDFNHRLVLLYTVSSFVKSDLSLSLLVQSMKLA